MKNGGKTAETHARAIELHGPGRASTIVHQRWTGVMPMASASDGLEFAIPGLPLGKNRLSPGLEEHRADIVMRT
jgi:hypothetical protein